jgi:hypothetical protein
VDSGIYLRGSGKHQVNIWCWPIGSGEMYGIRTNPSTPPELRAAVTPRMQADNLVGQWNRFEITVRDDSVRTVLNGKVVIPGARISDLPPRGRIALQHHGGRRDGQWTGPPSLLQFKNIFIKELDQKMRSPGGLETTGDQRVSGEPRRALTLTEDASQTGGSHGRRLCWKGCGDYRRGDRDRPGRGGPGRSRRRHPEDPTDVGLRRPRTLASCRNFAFSVTICPSVFYHSQKLPIDIDLPP